MTENQVTCAECDELLIQFFEHEIKDADRSRFDEHVSKCLRCLGLIRDIHGIQSQAADLPEMVPSRDLWSGIESRIQPEVRSISSPRWSSTSRMWLAAAAAALMIATSGITYLATRRSVNDSAVSVKSAAPVVSAPQVAMAAPEAAVAAPRKSSTSVRREPAPARTTPKVSLASSSSSPRAPTASEIAFAGEIVQLQSVVAQRRSQLDPETVKVVEDNLKLIDTAVQRARLALKKDPASGFLTRQLDGVLQKKVELLRTVALLPSST